MRRDEPGRAGPDLPRRAAGAGGAPGEVGAAGVEGVMDRLYPSGAGADVTPRHDAGPARLTGVLSAVDASATSMTKLARRGSEGARAGKWATIAI